MKRQPLWKKLAALAAALALTAALAGCGSAGGGSDAAPGETAATESFSMDNAALAADGGGAATLTPQATGESARKIIYNADLSLESTDFDAARTALTDAVEAHGGYISYSDLSGSAEDQDRYSHYTVRIPADSYRAFLEAVSGAANVLSVSESAEDITSEYIDVEARIASLENQRSRLNELADTAETTADLLEIESQLSDVQYQLESYTRQRSWMDDQVQYSTVDIRLSEVKTLTPETPVGFAEEAGRAFLDGWEAFSLFIKGLVLGLIYAWPAVLIVVIVVIVVVRTHPARQARRAARLAQRTAPPPPPKPAVPGAKDAPQPPAPEDTPKPKY